MANQYNFAQLRYALIVVDSILYISKKIKCNKSRVITLDLLHFGILIIYLQGKYPCIWKF
jgi:hypothetical protein